MAADAIFRPFDEVHSTHGRSAAAAINALGCINIDIPVMAAAKAGENRPPLMREYTANRIAMRISASCRPKWEI